MKSNNNQYYNNKYCTSIPIESYGDQFKGYLDSKLNGLLTNEELKKVDEHLTDVMVNVEGNIAGAIIVAQENLATKIDNSDTHVICHVKNIVNDSINKTKCIVEHSKNEIIEAIDKTNCIVKTESELAKERMEKIREDLIASINNNNTLIDSGFSNLNNVIIANKEDTVIRVNSQASKNKYELLDAIYEGEFIPFIVYGGKFYNIIHPTISTINETNILTLPEINVTAFTTEIVFSMKVLDVAVPGMNNDSTGDIYKEAKIQNEQNIVFVYPKKYDSLEIFDPMDVNITNMFDKTDIIINKLPYTLIMYTAKIVNLYDPEWEMPLNYTLNYTLKLIK